MIYPFCNDKDENEEDEVYNLHLIHIKKGGNVMVDPMGFMVMISQTDEMKQKAQQKPPLSTKKKALFVLLFFCGLATLVFSILFMVRYKQGTANVCLDPLFHMFWISMLISSLWNCWLYYIFRPYIPCLALEPQTPSVDLFATTFFCLVLSLVLDLVSKCVWANFLFQEDCLSSSFFLHEPLYWFCLIFFGLGCLSFIFWSGYTCRLLQTGEL